MDLDAQMPLIRYMNIMKMKKNVFTVDLRVTEVDVLILREESISMQAVGINVFGVVQLAMIHLAQELDAYITPRGFMKNRFCKGPINLALFPLFSLTIGPSLIRRKHLVSKFLPNEKMPETSIS